MLQSEDNSDNNNYIHHINWITDLKVQVTLPIDFKNLISKGLCNTSQIYLEVIFVMGVSGGVL